MTAALTARSTGALHGLYPFRPARDLGGVVPLLQMAFRDDLDSQDLAWLADLGALGTGNTWMRFLLRMLPPSAGLFGGFVWYEEGRLIANVSLMRADKDAWVIANVATDPEYRRRGIGRMLITAAVDAARAGDARAVGLQVRDDNAPAKMLYDRLGFARVGAATTFSGEAIGLDDAPKREGIATRPWSPGPSAEVRRVMALADALEGAWPPGPLRQSVQRRGIGGRLDDVFRGRERRGWIVTADSEPCAVGVVYVERTDTVHTAEFAVLPTHRGAVEDVLLRTAVDVIASSRAAVRVEVPESETGVVATLGQWGFQPVRTLDRMVLRLV